jgi:hypothetical protein
VKQADNLALILCVGVPKKGGKASNVKKYTKTGRRTLQLDDPAYLDSAISVLATALTLTCGCLKRDLLAQCEWGGMILFRPRA